MTIRFSTGKEVEFIYKTSPYFGKIGTITSITESGSTSPTTGKPAMFIGIKVEGEHVPVTINDVSIPLDEQIALR